MKPDLEAGVGAGDGGSGILCGSPSGAGFTAVEIGAGVDGSPRFGLADSGGGGGGAGNGVNGACD